METGNLNLESRLEALLFWKGEPMAVKKAVAALGCTDEEFKAALAALSATLAAGNRGLRVVEHDGEVELRTAPEASGLIEKLTKEELYRDLGKAGLETLTILLYKGSAKRSEIDYIRGVNSSFILRNLLVRGLVERVTERAEKPTDAKRGEAREGQPTARGYSYKPTLALLSHLGVTKLSDLPDYEKVRAELAAFESSEHEA